MIRILHLCGLLAVLSPAVLSQGTVSPADRSALEGSSFTHFPLGRPSLRLQTLHADLPPGAPLQGHAYRADAVQTRSRVEAFSVDLLVTASVSPRTPGTASATFTDNAGPSPVLVLPRMVVAFPATERPAIDPAPGFAFAIPWQVPFVPPPGATVCLDVRTFGNFTAQGNDRSFSVWLDSHTQYPDGRNEQPGYRSGQGCPPPGRTALPFGTFSLWNTGAQSQLDVALRNGVPDDGTGLAQPFVALGLQPRITPFPGTGCALLTSTDLWWALPGSNDPQGSYTGNLMLPLLPAGWRIHLQGGSIHLGTGALAFGDVSTLLTNPPGPVPVSVARIVASTDGGAATGSVSLAVPVTRFL